MRRWFYGPFKDYLHKIVAGWQCTVGRHHPPDGAGVFSNSADMPASHLLQVPARPALQVFFLRASSARLQRQRHAILCPARHLFIQQQRGQRVFCEPVGAELKYECVAVHGERCARCFIDATVTEQRG